MSTIQHHDSYFNPWGAASLQQHTAYSSPAHLRPGHANAYQQWGGQNAALSGSAILNPFYGAAAGPSPTPNYSGAIMLYNPSMFSEMFSPWASHLEHQNNPFAPGLAVTSRKPAPKYEVEDPIRAKYPASSRPGQEEDPLQWITQDLLHQRDVSVEVQHGRKSLSQLKQAAISQPAAKH